MLEAGPRVNKDKIQTSFGVEVWRFIFLHQHSCLVCHVHILFYTSDEHAQYRSKEKQGHDFLLQDKVGLVHCWDSLIHWDFLSYCTRLSSANKECIHRRRGSRVQAETTRHLNGFNEKLQLHNDINLCVGICTAQVFIDLSFHCHVPTHKTCWLSHPVYRSLLQMLVDGLKFGTALVNGGEWSTLVIIYSCTHTL